MCVTGGELLGRFSPSGRGGGGENEHALCSHLLSSELGWLERKRNIVVRHVSYQDVSHEKGVKGKRVAR